MNEQIAYKTARADRYVAEATAALETGFTSKAAQKRALESVGRAYEYTRDMVHDQVITAAREAVANWEADEGRQAYIDFLRARDMPFDLHQVRDKHFAALVDFPIFERARDLAALREAIRATEITLVERDEQVEKVEAVRRTILQEMEARKANYVRGLDLSERFGFQVSVNAHYVRNDKGTVFVRHFFYMWGKLTALNTILAIADKMARDEEAAK